MNDEWTAKLSDGREIRYKCKTLLSGRIRVSAQVVGADTDHSRIIEEPVDRKAVEKFFLNDLA